MKNITSTIITMLVSKIEITQNKEVYIHYRFKELQKSASQYGTVTTVISTYNETAKYRKVPPENIMKVIRKITYDKESVRIILAGSLYIRGNVKTG